MPLFEKGTLKDTFSKLSSSAKQTAENVVNVTKESASTVAKKSNELVEISKMTVAINTNENKMNTLFSEIGKMVAAKHEKGIYIDPDLVEKCDEILKLKNDIIEIREKITEIKNKKVCPNCNTELDLDIRFCPNCGQELFNDTATIEITVEAPSDSNSEDLYESSIEIESDTNPDGKIN